MDTSLFIRLLSNLLSVSSMCLTDPNRELKAFEEKNCLVPSMQPMFTAEAIGFLLPSPLRLFMRFRISWVSASRFFNFRRTLISSVPMSNMNTRISRSSSC